MAAAFVPKKRDDENEIGHLVAKPAEFHQGPNAATLYCKKTKTVPLFWQRFDRAVETWCYCLQLMQPDASYFNCKLTLKFLTVYVAWRRAVIVWNVPYRGTVTMSDGYSIEKSLFAVGSSQYVECIILSKVSVGRTVVMSILHSTIHSTRSLLVITRRFFDIIDIRRADTVGSLRKSVKVFIFTLQYSNNMLIEDSRSVCLSVYNFQIGNCNT
jgi:hypothetical protein